MPPGEGVTTVEDGRLVFRQPDPDGRWRAVRLWQELGLAADDLAFTPVPGGWELRLAMPPVQRLEYLYELTDAAGDSWTTTDPTNPALVPGVFGDKSWLALPGYTAPDWTLVPDRIDWTARLLGVEDRLERVQVMLCEPEGSGSDRPLPLLLAHDGGEYARFAALADYLAVQVAVGGLPPLRLALLEPGERNRRYSALPAYTASLTGTVLPALADEVAVAGPPVLAGVSLGALAALHAAWSRPTAFAGLWLQSGSFFTPATDPQEHSFAYFERICSFVEQVHTRAWPATSDDATTGPAGGARPVVAMTCGAAEENVHCNRLMAARLGELGLSVHYTEHPDVHSFTSWRDALHPGLVDLLARVWS